MFIKENEESVLILDTWIPNMHILPLSVHVEKYAQFVNFLHASEWGLCTSVFGYKNKLAIILSEADNGSVVLEVYDMTTKDGEDVKDRLFKISQVKGAQNHLSLYTECCFNDENKIISTILLNLMGYFNLYSDTMVQIGEWRGKTELV